MSRLAAGLVVLALQHSEGVLGTDKGGGTGNGSNNNDEKQPHPIKLDGGSPGQKGEEKDGKETEPQVGPDKEKDPPVETFEVFDLSKARKKYRKDVRRLDRDFLRSGFTRVLKQQHLWWTKGYHGLLIQGIDAYVPPPPYVEPPAYSGKPFVPVESGKGKEEPVPISIGSTPIPTGGGTAENKEGTEMDDGEQDNTHNTEENQNHCPGLNDNTSENNGLAEVGEFMVSFRKKQIEQLEALDLKVPDDFEYGGHKYDFKYKEDQYDVYSLPKAFDSSVLNEDDDFDGSDGSSKQCKATQVTSNLQLVDRIREEFENRENLKAPTFITELRDEIEARSEEERRFLVNMGSEVEYGAWKTAEHFKNEQEEEKWWKHKINSETTRIDVARSETSHWTPLMHVCDLSRTELKNKDSSRTLEQVEKDVLWLLEKGADPSKQVQEGFLKSWDGKWGPESAAAVLQRTWDELYMDTTAKIFDKSNIDEEYPKAKEKVQGLLDLLQNKENLQQLPFYHRFLDQVERVWGRMIHADTFKYVPLFKYRVGQFLQPILSGLGLADKEKSDEARILWEGWAALKQWARDKVRIPELVKAVIEKSLELAKVRRGEERKEKKEREEREEKEKKGKETGNGNEKGNSNSDGNYSYDKSPQGDASAEVRGSEVAGSGWSVLLDFGKLLGELVNTWNKAFDRVNSEYQETEKSSGEDVHRKYSYQH